MKLKEIALIIHAMVNDSLLIGFELKDDARASAYLENVFRTTSKKKEHGKERPMVFVKCAILFL